VGGRIQSFQEKGLDLSKHHQIPWLSLSQGQCRLGPERKQAVCSIPAPKTHWQIRDFL
jgi:hypothetical protein